jgi:hypothetical protein
MKLGFRASLTLRILALRTTAAVAFAVLATPGLAQTGPQPTATEVFHLRSECAALGEKLADNIRAAYSPDVSIYDPISHYDPRTNRCYVQLQSLFIDKKERVQHISTFLYDGQTRELLACARLKTDKQSVLHDPHNSEILNRLQLSSDEAFAFINERMADDRMQ